MSVRGTFLVLALLVSHGVFAVETAGVADEPEIVKVIDELVKDGQFKRDALQSLFSGINRDQRVIDLMERPAESLPWFKYRNIFMQELRINLGVEFWQKNAQVLAKAEEEYGVPAEVIIGIIGVETRYGQNTGQFRVIDALATLAAFYPKRSDFFRKELVQYLKLTQREKIDPLSMTGSYAGALGKAQFMPSSYIAYAVDYDRDGSRDLLNSDADAIGSVANYLKRHGWERGAPITGRARVEGDHYDAVLKTGLEPKFTLKQARKQGVIDEDKFDGENKITLVELDADGSKEYWIGLPNFYAITRYNRSPLYAMAVVQLGAAVRDARSKLATGK